MAVVFLVAATGRWLTIHGIGGDDHWALWNAAVFLKGDTWFDGFVDMGDPLYWLMSAFGQWVTGYRLIGEIGLAVTLVAVALTLCFDMAWEASRSWVIAAAMGIFALALVAVTDIYSHPKVFLYPLGAWLSWRYIERPTRLRAVLLALGVAIAFGYRHDHGAYVGLGSMVAVVIAHWEEGVRAVTVAAGRLTLAGTVLLSPFFLIVQANEGVVSYFRDRIEFARQIDEAGRRAVPWVVDASRPGFLVGLMPLRSARVAVEWAGDVTAARRAGLEARHGLSGGVDPATGFRSYRLLDTSDENVRAVMGEPRIDRVDGIAGSFRRAWELSPRPPDEAPLTIVWDASVDAAARRRMEERYQLVLVSGTPGSGASLEYDILDRSPENLFALSIERATAGLSGMRPVIRSVVARLRRPAMAGPRVAVQWREGVTEQERTTLEASYQLVATGPVDADSRWGSYELADYSTENVTALVTDARLENRGGFRDGPVEGTYVVTDDIPEPGSPVFVIWAADVGDAERLALEARYSLTPANRGGGFWEYVMADTGPAAIAALVEDPAVVATSGIDRAGLRPEGESWLAALGRRVPLFRLAVWPRIVHVENAGVWLYYVVYLLPWVVLGLLGWDRFRGGIPAEDVLRARKMLALAAMMALAHFALMRKLGYVADHVDVAMVFGAWCLGRFRRDVAAAPSAGGGRRAWRVTAGAGTALVIGVSAMATWHYANVPSVWWASTGFDRGLPTVSAISAQKFTTWATSPPIDAYAPLDVTGDRALIRYFHECTTPEDRIWALTDMYTTPYYAERRVVRHIFWGNGFQNSAREQEEVLDLLERDPVPFIVAVGGARPLQFLEDYDLLHAYASERYAEFHPILQDGLARQGAVIWMSVDSRRTPTRMYESLGLPCFA
jgi:hypothetical protein